MHGFMFLVGDLGVSGTEQANVLVLTPWVCTVRLQAVVPSIADLRGARAGPSVPWC